MEELVAFVYDGGMYRFNELEEVLEDTGSFILRKEDTRVSTTAMIVVPANDLTLVEERAREIGGRIAPAPLAMSEIAVVAPSASQRHLPHPTCDIAEYLRRAGAQTILISLARGVGQDPLIRPEEEMLINETDVAVFALGDAEYCLTEKKFTMLKGVDVPTVVAGGPHGINMPHVDAYIGGFGRKWDRMKGLDDLNQLEELVSVVAELLSKRRKRLYPTFPSVTLPSIGQLIERHVPEIMDVLAPSPITVKLDGLRVKLPYDEFAKRVAEVPLEEGAIRQIASITRSVLKDYLLVRIKSVS